MQNETTNYRALPSGAEDAKTRAGQVAQSAAPGRVIADEISVQPEGEESEARGIIQHRRRH